MKPKTIDQWEDLAGCPTISPARISVNRSALLLPSTIRNEISPRGEGEMAEIIESFYQQVGRVRTGALPFGT